MKKILFLISTIVILASQTSSPALAEKRAAQSATNAVSELMTTTVLTDAEIKALPTTPVVIVPAPGADKIIFVRSAWLRMDWHADYANIDDLAQITLAGTNTLVSLKQEFNNSVSALLAGGGNEGVNAFTGMDWLSFVMTVPGTTSPIAITGMYDSDVVNKPFFLSAINHSLGDFTGGDPDNTLTVTVFYVVLDLYP